MLIILKRTIITKTNMNDWDKFIFYKYFIFYEIVYKIFLNYIFFKLNELNFKFLNL